MLVVYVHNDGTGTNESSNYEYTVKINGDLIAWGTIKGHDRRNGWIALLHQLIEERINEGNV